MSIPKDVSHQLLGLSQLVLSNMETGKTFEAKCALLRMAAIISAESDYSVEIEKFSTAAGF